MQYRFVKCLLVQKETTYYSFQHFLEMLLFAAYNGTLLTGCSFFPLTPNNILGFLFPYGKTYKLGEINAFGSLNTMVSCEPNR